jgi:hypothetical protein
MPLSITHPGEERMKGRGTSRSVAVPFFVGQLERAGGMKPLE